jgi:group I intron endonuclease
VRYVYVIRNLIDGKIYVGQSKTPYKRRDGHFYAARSGSLRPLYCAIRKHGVENFTFEVVEECADELIDEREKHWVEKLDSYSEKGYNLTPGGSANQHFCDDVIEKRRRVGREIMLRMWHEPERRARRSASSSRAMERRHKEGRSHVPDWTGRRHSDATRAKMSQSQIGRQAGEKNSQYGKVWIHHPGEQVAKRVAKSDLQQWTNQGWVLGRKIMPTKPNGEANVS